VFGKTIKDRPGYFSGYPEKLGERL